MRRIPWQLGFALFLLALSVAVYVAQVVLFRRVDDTLFYLLQDLAFVPIQIVLVTLLLTGLLNRRQRSDRLRKLNMVVGTFFGEAGTPLLRLLAPLDANVGILRPWLLLGIDWEQRDFAAARERVDAHPFAVDSRRGDLGSIGSFLAAQRAFLLRLLENDSLLEHDEFSELLWAVFHLADELGLRADLTTLPDEDRDHISEDARRAYARLLVAWLGYVQHLRRDYPYIYSLIVRTNPFDPHAVATIGTLTSAPTRDLLATIQTDGLWRGSADRTN